ncbi:hypothetical protein R5R35_006395 [Gryllus longicercus]|uniref:Uncharacterized protein n=1 Tax=Gryllus longicercus TaxID=2509291 RepID=A0AAN9ZGC0_9ORTH
MKFKLFKKRIVCLSSPYVEHSQHSVSDAESCRQWIHRRGGRTQTNVFQIKCSKLRTLAKTTSRDQTARPRSYEDNLSQIVDVRK